MLAERLSPEPALVPVDRAERALMFGLSNDSSFTYYSNAPSMKGIGAPVTLVRLTATMPNSRARLKR